jgi:hypothetical protein
MKATKLIFTGIVFFLAITVKAQVSVNVNIGTPPPWGPAGYTQVRYYYLPDVESYYDVQSSMFIYYSGGAWVQRTNLPSQYRRYDLYHGYKVVMTDYHGNTPYTYFKEHKSKYHKGYHGSPQKTNKERPERGNSRGKMQSGDKSQKMDRHNEGNGKSMKKDQGHRNGNGKKK